jgi:HEAT repeat protein
VEQEINRLIQDLRLSSRQQQAAEELVKIGTPAVEPLLQAFGKDAKPILAEILAKIGTPHILEPLLITLYDVCAEDDWESISPYAKIFAHLKNQDAIELLIGEFERAIAQPDIQPSCRDMLSSCFYYIGDPAVPSLTNLLRRTPNDAHATHIIHTLYNLKDPQAVAPLLERLTQTPDGSFRHQLLMTLAMLKCADVAPELIQILRDPERPIALRMSAASSIGYTQAEGVYEALLVTLQEHHRKDDESSMRLRQMIFQGFWLLGDSRAVPVSLQTLQDSDEHDYVRDSALTTLASLDKETARPVLEQILLDSRASDTLRHGAAFWLHRIQDPRSIAVLVRALDEPLRLVRSHAAAALGELQATQAVNRLIELVENRDTGAAAVEALRKIGYPRAQELHDHYSNVVLRRKE